MINNLTYYVQQNAAASQANRYAWALAAAPSNPYADLPSGQYTVSVLTAEQVTGKLSHKETLTPPTVTSVALTQPPASNTVAVDVTYGTGDPDSTTIELYYSKDATAGTGTRFDSFSLKGMANTGTVRRTFELNTDPTLSAIPLQVWKLGYHVYAGSTMARPATARPRPARAAGPWASRLSRRRPSARMSTCSSRWRSRPTCRSIRSPPRLPAGKCSGRRSTGRATRSGPVPEGYRPVRPGGDHGGAGEALGRHRHAGQHRRLPADRRRR